MTTNRYPFRFAPEGDAGPWLLMRRRRGASCHRSHDMFAISRPGDEISLSFDARRLPPLPAGWTRTSCFILMASAKRWIHQLSQPDQVAASFMA